jgi:1-phosphofructokinase
MNRPNRFIVVGLHPAIDRTLEIPRFAPGAVIPARVVMVEAAGKGANVAHSLSNFGHRVFATGFIGHREKEFFLSSFARPRNRSGRAKIEFVRVESATRENITIIERDARTDTHLLAGELRVRARSAQAIGPCSAAAGPAACGYRITLGSSPSAPERPQSSA